jgi:hypothetical protein
MNLLLSFLPKRYRERFTAYEVPSSAALWSGILETLVSLGFFIHGYFSYANARMAALPASVLTGAAEKGGETAVMAFGPIVLLEYLIHISAIVFVFFTIEGLVRSIAALASDETLPSLPLQLAAFVHTQFEARSHEKSMGDRIRDEVQLAPGSDSLQIASCRPKLWRQLTTISYDGNFYELVGESRAATPRPFVYTLRRKPVTGVIRGICPYDPEEVLQTK